MRENRTGRNGRTLRAAGKATAVAAVALLLAACGSDDPQASTEPAVTLDSTTTPTAAAPATPGATTNPNPDVGGGQSDDFVLVGAPTLVDELADLDVEDQRGDGRSVLVDEARSGQSVTLIGIYDAGQNVLGFGEVHSGSQPVTIELTRPVTSSQELFAVLHADSNGNGKLDSDDAVLVEEGEQVTEDFDYVLN